MPGIYHGFLVNLDTTEDGNLNILLNTNGQRVLAEIERMRDRLGSEAALLVILSDHLKRRWTQIRPEEIGALTAATILSDEARRDSAGVLKSVGRVYWHSQYQVEDPIEELSKKGSVRFEGAE